MFVYGVIVFLVFGVLTSVTSTVMQIHVNDRVSENERFSWWSRNGAALARKHRELFPDSPLPDIARYSYWTCLLLFGIAVLISFLDR